MPGPNLLAVDVPLSTFLGLNTEVSPPDCPEGVSPDNQDVAYIPGNVFSRPGLHKVFSPSFPNNPSVTYQRTYVRPNQSPLNLYQTSDGILWQEDPVNSPGFYTQIAQLIAGAYARSVTAFGREYITQSDGKHGVGVPLQYDGTYLDRVSQDGPGLGPTIANYLPPPAVIESTGIPLTVNIANSPNGIVWGGVQVIYIPPGHLIAHYTYFTVTTSIAHGFVAGDRITLAGTTSTPSVNGTFVIQLVPSPTTFTIAASSTVGTTANGGGGTATESSSAYSLIRASNVILAVTLAAHGFQQGWQVQISIANTTIGGGISSVSRDGNGNVTVVTAGAHGLSVGNYIAIVGVNNPDASFNGNFYVTGVTNSTTFTYLQPGTVEASSGGSGNVQDIWNTTAIIQSVPSPTTFTYNQSGPNDSTTAIGTATIVGQISAGAHNVVMMFLTRQGYLTAPSPVQTFVANGGQQLQLSNLAIGPPNIVARVFGITGSGGDNYFTQLVAPQVNGSIVGTSLIVPDNVTTSAIIDLADNTIFGGVGIDIPGNNLFALVVLGPCLGFYSYASRLMAWGEWNKVQNLVNMGFCGGYQSGNLNVPLGWSTSGSGGVLVNGGPWAGGMAWQITGDGTTNAKGLIQQTAYQDENGLPIALPLTAYLIRLWAVKSLADSTGSVIADFFSPSQGGLGVATIPMSSIPQTVGGFVNADFSVSMPATVPSDTVIRFYMLDAINGQTVTLSELELVYQEEPYLDSTFRFSYVNNPESFDGVTGNLGPTDDPYPIRGPGELRNTLYFLTAKRVHSTTDNGSGEPGTWTVNEVASNCGALSSFGITTQREESGEEWMAWASDSGTRMFEGGDPGKISQEIQTDWGLINLAAKQTIWAVNDTVNRRVYFGIPVNGATAPNRIQPMDYRELDTGSEIKTAASIHISFTGKMIASDLARKWTRWNIAANCAAMLYRGSTLGYQFTMGGGNGLTPGTANSFGNVYYLDSAKLTDDDYGQIVPYYVTYFFINHEMEQTIGVGSHRKLFKAFTMFISGVGTVTCTPLVDTLQNPWTASLAYPMSQNPTADIAIGMQVSAERVAYKIQVSPLPGTTNVQFNLQKIIATIVQHPWSPMQAGGGI